MAHIVYALFQVSEAKAAEARPWLELLRDGTFSADTLAYGEVPLS
jgi:hypothetical protein